MTIYAVGDLQGCLDPLKKLLDKVHFDPHSDQLWVVGDLVNRGSQSLETLRFLKALGPAAITILGNHDLHLLAVAHGYKDPHKKDTFQDILNAQDRESLLDWLRRRPLIHYDPGIRWLMVHAGIPPQWNLQTAISCAKEISEILRDDSSFSTVFQTMYGNEPRRWNPTLQGLPRIRYILNAFVRMRYLDDAGDLEFRCKNAYENAPNGLIPWFMFPNRETQNDRIVFGHWSTLSLMMQPRLLALDTGCVWGDRLTIAELNNDDRPIRIESVFCKKRPRNSKKR